MAQGRRLFRVHLDLHYLRRFQMAQPFRMVRGHHLFRVVLVNLNRPLFRKDPHFLMVRHLH